MAIQMQDPQKILRELGLADSEVEVYLAMRGGARRVADIMKVTGRKRPTVYYAIDCLERRGLVSKSGEGSALRLEPPSRLKALAEEKREEAQELAASVELWAAGFTQGDATSERPAVSFFEGIEAVKSVVMESLYCKNKSIDVVAPHDNFFWQIGRDFVEQYIELRGKRGVKTRSLWERKVDPAVFKKYYAERSSVAILPKVMHGKFKTSVFLYDDKTLYISSRKGAYCILITSKEHHDTMRAWFDGLWDASVPHPRK